MDGNETTSNFVSKPLIGDPGGATDRSWSSAIFFITVPWLEKKRKKEKVDLETQQIDSLYETLGGGKGKEFSVGQSRDKSVRV